MVDQPAGAAAVPTRVRIPHLGAMKAQGHKWAMLTAYDMYAASIFDEAGIPVLLVGDSAGNNVFGYDSTVPVGPTSWCRSCAPWSPRPAAPWSWPTCLSAPTGPACNRASTRRCGS